MNRWALSQSPRVTARLAGVLYLLTILTGATALFVSGGLNSGMVLVSTLCYVAVTVLFYSLFRPVNRTVSVLAACFSLVGCALSLLSLFHFVSSRLNPLVFFGFYCLLIGYLILRSAFLPRAVGAFMVFGGVGWLTFLSERLSSFLSPYNLAPGILGEVALTLWLLAFGVNVERWNQQAKATA